MQKLKPSGFFLGLLTLTALAACGQQLTQPQEASDNSVMTATDAGAGGDGLLSAQTLSGQSLTAQSSGELRNYIADVTVQTTVQGSTGAPTTTTATGLKAAYSFNGSEVKARMDIPAAQNPDGRARIVAFDSVTDRAVVLFADTMQPDLTTSQADLENMVKQQTQTVPITEMGINALRSVTPAQFSAKQAGAGKAVSTVSRTDGLGGTLLMTSSSRAFGSGGQATTESYYDPLEGVVNRHETVLENQSARVTNSTKIDFASVTNISGINIPTRMTTQQTSTAKSLGTSANMTQTIQYNNVQINTLSDSYFNVGGL